MGCTIGAGKVLSLYMPTKRIICAPLRGALDIMRRCSLWVAAVCFFAVGGGEASAVNPRSLHALIADLLTARDLPERSDTASVSTAELYYTNRALLSAGDVWRSRDNLLAAASAADGGSAVPLLAPMAEEYFAGTADAGTVRALLPSIEKGFETLMAAAGGTSSAAAPVELYAYTRAAARCCRAMGIPGEKMWDQRAASIRSDFDNLRKSPGGDNMLSANEDLAPAWTLLAAGLADRQLTSAIAASVPAVAALISDSIGAYTPQQLLHLLDGLGAARLDDRADALARAVIESTRRACSAAGIDVGGSAVSTASIPWATVPDGARAALFETAYRRLYPSDAATDAPRVANVVCIVRSTVPAHEGVRTDTMPDSRALLEATRSQSRLLDAYGIRGTYLVQYDALSDTAFCALLRDLQERGADIGAWFEITEPLAKGAGSRWESRSPTDPRAQYSLSAGYKPKDREHLADEYFRRFKAVFGAFPACVGAPAIDAHTAAYMQRKYAVEAFAIASDTESGARRLTVADPVEPTAPVSLSGGYFQGGYYPSKRNIIMPAQTPSEGIKAPVFRIPSPDPERQYSPERFSREVMRRMMNDLFYSPASGSVHFVATYPNYLPSAAAREEMEYIVPLLARLGAKGDIRLETMAESGRKFRAAGSVTPPAALTATLREDPASGQTASGVLLYGSPYYRMVLGCEPGETYVRDIHLFDESMEEPYLREPCIGRGYSVGALPVVDGYRWSNDSIRGGMRFYTLDSAGVSAPMRFGAPHVARGGEMLSVIVPVIPPESATAADTISRRDLRLLRRRLGNTEILSLDGDTPRMPVAGDTIDVLQMVITFRPASVEFTLSAIPGSGASVPRWYAAMEHVPGAPVPFAGAALTFDTSSMTPLPASMADAVAGDFRYRITSPDATITDTSTRPRLRSGALRALTIVPDVSTITLNLSK